MVEEESGEKKRLKCRKIDKYAQDSINSEKNLTPKKVCGYLYGILKKKAHNQLIINSLRAFYVELRGVEPLCR